VNLFIDCKLAACGINSIDSGTCGRTLDYAFFTVFQTDHLMPIVEYMLLECPIRAPHSQMGRSDWTLLTTSVSPLASSDMCVATGHVQECSVDSGVQIKVSFLPRPPMSKQIMMMNACRLPVLDDAG
jgi:hypothetical protein